MSHDIENEFLDTEHIGEIAVDLKVPAEYLIVSNHSPEQVSKEVSALMRKGWCLKGSVSVALSHHVSPSGTQTSTRTIYAQSLVKYQSVL